MNHVISLARTQSSSWNCTFFYPCKFHCHDLFSVTLTQHNVLLVGTALESDLTLLSAALVNSTLCCISE